MDAEEILFEAEERMDGAVNHLAGQLSGLRSGRASPALVDKIPVSAYDTTTPLGQMAQIGCPEPRQILIKPYDPSVLKNIEKAIQASDLGLNPSSDGKVLRLSLPPLSEERRKQLVKVVREHGEATNVSIRNIRRDANKQSDASLGDKVLTEDQAKKLKDEIQELTKTHEAKVKELVERKTEELMEV
ncbi:MAG: ribosome recycling factor [Planctomycetota bacterium]|jgi:ribosome recycling factor